MFRKKIDRDISDEEVETIIEPHSQLMCDYIENKIAPSYFAFYLANGYKMSSMWECSYDRHMNSALDVFNIIFQNKKRIKEKTKKILLKKYGYKITCEDPLTFEEQKKEQ